MPDHPPVGSRLAEFGIYIKGISEPPAAPHPGPLPAGEGERTRRRPARRKPAPESCPWPAPPREYLEIIHAVMVAFGVNNFELFSRTRRHRVACARHAGMYLCRQVLGWSFPDIGRAFGRGHASAVYGWQRVIDLAPDPDDPLVRGVNEAWAMLRSRGLVGSGR